MIQALVCPSCGGNAVVKTGGGQVHCNVCACNFFPNGRGPRNGTSRAELLNPPQFEAPGGIVGTD